MDARKTSYGSDAHGLAEMIGLGAGGDCDEDMTPTEVREERLGRALRATQPPTPAQARELSLLAGRLRDAMPLAGRPVGDVLLDPQAELTVLTEIKEHGKADAAAADSEIDRDVGLTVYFAAIAGAILFHGERITSYSYAALADAFSRLVNKRWMHPELARHFAKARRRCKRKAR
jgi:hypothetical protein